MTTLLNKELVTRLLGSVYPRVPIKDDCVASILQMVSPFNDLFTDKTKDECVELVNTYFEAKLATFTLNQLNKPLNLHESLQEIIIVCLISKLLEISGNAAIDIEYEVYGWYDYNSIEISVYYLYSGLVANLEIKQMFGL